MYPTTRGYCVLCLTVMISQVKVPLIQAIAESHPPNCEQVIQSWHVSTACVWHPPLPAGDEIHLYSY